VPAHGGLLGLPIFSAELDADPKVKAWLARLTEDDRAALRDDPTPLFKEVLGEVEVEASEGDDEAETDLWGELAAAAEKSLPPWKFRIFKLWFQGKNKQAIAKELGISRGTVRSALDGIGSTAGSKRAGPGALKVVAGNDAFRTAILRAAMRTVSRQKKRVDERALHWFTGIQNKPEMIEPLAMLLVADSLAGQRGQIKLGDLLTYFPRSRITPCMALLRAYGFAECDGHTIRIHKRPEKKSA
jgi:hypothetical protein